MLVKPSKSIGQRQPKGLPQEKASANCEVVNEVIQSSVHTQ
jgi:hypothetical protein